MKQIKYYFLTGLMLAFACQVLHAEDEETVTAIPANEFLNSIGVNTSINERGESITEVLKCARYMGFRYIRAGVPGGSNNIAYYRWLYNARVRFSCMLGTKDNIQSLVSGARSLVENISPDALIALEGCNEPNNWGVTYNGQKGGGFDEGGTKVQHDWKVLARYIRDFYAAVKADPVLKDYPVWSMTDGGASPSQWNTGLHYLTVPEDDQTVIEEFRGATFADVACVHNYFSGLAARSNNQTWRMADPTGAAGGNSLKANFGETWNAKFQGYSNEELMELPRVTTETGTTIDGYNVTEEYQALTYLSCYLAQFKRGWKYTAMYILRDRVDEGGNQTFGFYYRKDVSNPYYPRRSAHYLHNLTSILADTVSIETPGELTYTIAPSRPSTVHELLLQKENGTKMLVVWGEKYARSSVADEIEIRFNETFAKVNVYNPAQYTDDDPEIGTRPVAVYENVNSIPLAMLNHPFVIEINPVSTSTHNLLLTQRTRVYPNPVGEILSLRADFSVKQAEVYDLTGKKVLSRPDIDSTDADIDVSGLAKGHYIVRIIKTDGTTENHQIIKS